MAAVTVAATRRVYQPRHQQRLAVLAGEVAPDQVGGLVVTGATRPDLPDWRHGCVEIFHGLYLVRDTVAIRARGRCLVDAAFDFAGRPAMALTTGLTLVDSRHCLATVRPIEFTMTILARETFMDTGEGRFKIMASAACIFLAAGDPENDLGGDERKQTPDPGWTSIGQCHDYALIEESVQFKYVLEARNSIGVFRNRCNNCDRIQSQ
jgi:hypothetical protein